jgi:hypothetical protein
MYRNNPDQFIDYIIFIPISNFVEMVLENQQRASEQNSKNDA